MIGLFGNPLIQRQRPPQQTAAQQAAQAKLIAHAQADSDAAKSTVISLIDSFKQSLRAPLNTLTSEELLDRFTWEFKNLPLLHNGPLDNTDPAGINDDTPLSTTLSNGYLQNVCQRYVLGGAESYNNFCYEHNIMVTDFALPPFRTPGDCQAAGTANPTLRETNDCVLYAPY